MVEIEEGGLQLRNIIKLEAVVHEEWVKIPREYCQKQVSGCASHLQRVMAKNALQSRETPASESRLPFGSPRKLHFVTHLRKTFIMFVILSYFSSSCVVVIAKGW